MLEGVGLPTALLPLAALRGGPEAVAAAMRQALSARRRALVCDAATTADLETIARARGLLEFEPVWVGSGGLAAALASAELPGQDPPPPRSPAARGGLLLVVGSLAEASAPPPIMHWQRADCATSASRPRCCTPARSAGMAWRGRSPRPSRPGRMCWP
ncbi:four-carbon acid sugar kinase family protein [Pseudoroseomonas wenyumeiae]